MPCLCSEHTKGVVWGGCEFIVLKGNCLLSSRSWVQSRPGEPDFEKDSSEMVSPFFVMGRTLSKQLICNQQVESSNLISDSINNKKDSGENLSPSFICLVYTKKSELKLLCLYPPKCRCNLMIEGIAEI